MWHHRPQPQLVKTVMVPGSHQQRTLRLLCLLRSSLHYHPILFSSVQFSSFQLQLPLQLELPVFVYSSILLFSEILLYEMNRA